MRYFIFSSKFWACSLMVAGTSIGGGLLAFPSVVAVQGFWVAVALLFITALFGIFSSFFILEGLSQMDKDAHFFSLFEECLGNNSKFFASLLYVFICFASIVAYVSGAGDLTQHFLGMNRVVACVLVAAVHVLLISFGHFTSALANAVMFKMMIGILAAIGLSVIGISGKHNFSYFSFKDILNPFPVFLTAFSYQMVVPSLRSNISDDHKLLRASVVVGVSISFFVYVFWLAIIFSILPSKGPNSLMAMYEASKPVTIVLFKLSDNDFLKGSIAALSYFSLSTSFIGVSLGFVDFLADLFAVNRTQTVRSVLSMLTIIPASIIAVSYDKLFMFALDISGGVGDAVLYGLMPFAMMVSFIRKDVLDKNLKNIYYFGMFLVPIVSCASLYVEFFNFPKFF